MRKDCDEGCVMERREARADARGMSCFNMAIATQQDTRSETEERAGVAMGEKYIAKLR
jgi:hypothetical protein